MPAAILLAAGFSRRLGRPKQTILFHGETLIARAARIAHETGLEPIIAVLNPANDFAATLPSCLIVLNDEAAEGIASSIRSGIRAAQQCHATGAVLMTCDQPAVTPAHLRALIANLEAVTGSRYAGRTGVPAYFPASSFHQLLQLHGDTGARALLHDARYIETETLSLDIDTEADLASAQLKA